jgi:hypothetical protein
MPNNITDEAIGLLNILQAAAPDRAADLIQYRIQVPESDALDDFICQKGREGKCFLSTIGLINTILAKAGQPKVAAIVEDGGRVVGFTKMPDIVPAAPKPTT